MYDYHMYGSNDSDVDSYTDASDWCSHCERYFSSADALASHNRHCHHQCRTCGAVCRNKAALDAHTHERHPHWCQFCDRVFGTSGALNNHRRACHWACSQCPGRWFNSSEALAQHERDYHRRTYYWCAGCGMELDSEESLLAHTASKPACETRFLMVAGLVASAMANRRQR